MKTPPQADFAHCAILAALPDTGQAPEWVTVFPRIGKIGTVDGRNFTVDADQLIAAFTDGGIDVAVDINHASDLKGAKGEPSPAYGWIKALRVEGGALQARVDWLAEGAQLVAEKKYRYVSPSFLHTKDADRRTLRLRALSLTNTPALGNQPALAHAQPDHPETKMEKLAAALGVMADANEVAMLAALDGFFVAKGVHEAALAQLSAATTELRQIKDTARQAQVGALLDGAVKDKKILPAQRDHYASLCATDAGFESVKALLAATAPVLPVSGLDKKVAPSGDDAVASASPAMLAARAEKMVSSGEAADFLSAMTVIADQLQAAA